jgi:two-component system, NarL family, sensor kinase
VRLNSFWLLVGAFGMVLALELATPPDYVIGYLYILPMILINSRLRRHTNFQFILIAIALTVLNIWIPGKSPIQASMVVNRLITVLALVVTGYLSDRHWQIQRTLAEQQAQIQAQEKLMNMRTDFASTLAHDLKTPLLGAIETLKGFDRGLFGSIQSKQKTVLGTLIRSHQTSLKLVETLLDVYRNETEGLELQLMPVDLVTLAEDVATSMLNLSTSRRVYLSLNYGASDFRKFLWVNGDAFQLQRVLANLLTNAINHSPRGAKVKVVLEAHAEYQIVKVIDSGAGIKPNEMPHLFERFYQGQSDRQASGSGLGLYLTRQIIEAHGGTIWAENHLPHGAVFAFKLSALPYSSN